MICSGATPRAGLARDGLPARAWLSAGSVPGCLAVVTETGRAASITESAGRIWAVLAGPFGPFLVLLEHYPAPETGEGMEILNLVRVGTDGTPHWTRVRPAPQDNPRHAGL